MSGKQLTLKECLDQFGFAQLSEPEGLDVIDIDQFQLRNTEERARDNGVNDIPPFLQLRLHTFGHFLYEKYMLKDWPDAVFNKYLIWDGVDKDNQGWHTDMFESYDVFLLYYLDDTAPETGGSINFKWKNEEGISEELSFQPTAGDLFMISNKRGFWHKAGQSSIQRRVCSFDFNTNDS